MTNQNIKEFINNISQIKEWIAGYAARSSLTKKRYMRDITNFCEACNITTFEKLSTINSLDMEKFYDWARERKWSNVSINLVTQTLKTMFKFFSNNYNIKNQIINNLTSLPNDSEPQECFTQQEAELLLNTIKKHSKKKRQYAMFLLLLKGGLRSNELCNLKLSDIQEKGIRTYGKGSKVRIQPIPQSTLEVVNDYINTERKEVASKLKEEYNIETPYIFLAEFNRSKSKNVETGNRVLNASLNYTIKMYARKAGIKDYDKKHIHTCRHAYVTSIYSMTGGDIVLAQEMARHSNPSTTRRYIAVDETKIKNVIEMME